MRVKWTFLDMTILPLNNLPYKAIEGHALPKYDSKSRKKGI